MIRNVINVAELRQDISHAQTELDILVVEAEADYLADEATVRLEFAILEAEETLLAIHALKMRRAQKPTGS